MNHHEWIIVAPACRSHKSAVLYFTFQPEADLRNGEFFGLTLEEPRLWSAAQYSSRKGLLFCARENPSIVLHAVSEEWRASWRMYSLGKR